MPVSRPARRHSSSRQNALSGPDARFPRAIRGEDYRRYAAVMWAQAVRWLRGEAAHAVTDATPDAYSVVRAAAVMCVERDLYPQEEQLLSELMQREWDALVEERFRASPEIPTFLRTPN